MSWGGGDWMCDSCKHMNFKKRETCQRCAYPKYGGCDPSTYACNRTEVLAGDWYCNTINCDAHNYASRSNCYKCGALRTSNYNFGGYEGGYATDQSTLPPGWKKGDWMCTRVDCGVHNYASRTECFKCRTPNDFGGPV